MTTLAWMTVAALAALDSRVDAVFQENDRADSAGCAVGVYRDGAVAYSKGFGAASLEHGIPITPDTVLYVGPVSEQFTVMSVALAAREGTLSANALVLKRWRFEDEALEPVARDEFLPSLGTIRFQRGDSGEVTGFTISTSRTQNLRREKR